MTLNVMGLQKAFGNYLAVSNISFTVSGGEIFGLTGEKGAGKTTILKMIAGIIKPDAGQILWDGKPINRKTLKIGYLPEERGLYPDERISAQLMYFAKLKGMKKKEIKREMDVWLEKLGIIDCKDKGPQELSKSELQKVMLISALIHDPELILFDEPFSDLDAESRYLVKNIISELKEKRKAIILATSLENEIKENCHLFKILQKEDKEEEGMAIGEIRRERKKKRVRFRESLNPSI